MKNFQIEIILITSGAVLMVFELTASRLVAPYLGASLVVWTSIIGTILASLSLGYFLGGKLADKKPDIKILSSILITSALFILASALLGKPILDFLSKIETLDLRAKATLANIMLFSIPSILMGMVSPYSIKLKLKSTKNAGAVSGKLYALATLGSIIGTFAGGFFLIPEFGTIRILHILSAVMVFLAFLPEGKMIKGLVLKLIVLLIITISLFTFPYGNKNIIADFDTQYNRALVLDTKDPQSGKTIRYLNTNGGYSSASYLDSNQLAANYTRYFDLFKFFTNSPQKVLMVGGGAYSYPKYFLEQFPQSQIDVVEIDPKLTTISENYFNLKKNDRLKIYHEDGRVFLNRQGQKYDAILLDAAYRWSIPFQLTTQEFLKTADKNLAENGMVIMNFLGSIDGQKSSFLKSEYSTYKSVFPNVYIFTTNSQSTTKTIQNLILVAFKSKDTKLENLQNPNPELKKFLGNLYTGPINTNLPILTDDFAPVENLTL